mmetsp:Transcript_9742/g.24030  ORF Transcript_9742/g.24030 Transcript_9742/m.24030 type:complete len:276 (+) Transcript_9742:186-1013(+)|eukprot:CAMPEP_0178995134 /NCGR_PEP_ID=MMETSP0795-20121207/7672_1 /TAXON_ID=88552 /ORGANISM="Amoebophrya sp., Strain Ameob2" /LENGTH=275 /DNA_ID=CAMNT_0020687435 /DNA_START=168 /DNA_END=995 /DNA_ORIENTATION=-
MLQQPQIQIGNFPKPGQTTVTPTASVRTPAAAPAATAATSAAGFPVEKGGIQEHYDKATSVCGHIDDLVAALTELYEDNAKWKGKYIATKKAHFSKFFGASATMLLGSTFREWKAWSGEQTASRKYDALRMEQEIAEREWNLKLENQEKEHDKRLQALEANHKLAIAELSEQIANRNTEIQKLSAEKDSVFGKGEKSYKVLQSLKHQLEALDDEEFSIDTQRSLPVATNSFDFLKNRLHDLLNQVDPKYVPPLGSLSLIQAPQPLSSGGGSYQVR